MRTYCVDPNTLEVQEVRINHLFPTLEEVAELATLFPHIIYFTTEG